MRRLQMVCLLLLLSSTLIAQTAKLRGRVLDSTGAGMAAAVKVLQADKLIKEGVATAIGDFELDLPAGEYRLEITAPDFNPYGELVRVTPNMTPLRVTLTLAVLTSDVSVTAEANPLEVSLDTSLGTTTISGEQLDQLPEDEEELLEYLQQLAAAGAGGQAGSLVIDGFSSGRLPPRNQIQQVVIENNPFGAEGRGGPRIRVITRAGTGDWRGGLGFNFRDESLNARNPFSPDRPGSQSRNFSPNFSGPLIPGRVSLNFSASSQESESEGGALRAITPFGLVSSGVVSPNVNRALEPRFTIQLSNKHRLNLNLGYRTRKSENQNIGGFSLPERASNSESRNWQVQVSESTTIGSSVTNEIRFQVQRNTSSQEPVTSSVAINVQDAFQGGGAQNRSNDRSTDYQFENQIRAALGKGKIQLNSGVELTHADSFNFSESNYLGTFTFSGLHDYCYATGFQGVNCEETRIIVETALAEGQTPIDSLGREITGIPITFTQTSGDPALGVKQTEFSAYMELSMRATQKLSLQMNLRYQAQTNLSDYNNLDPRLSLRYQLRPGTILQIGSGTFHSGFDMGNVEQLLRNDGAARQFQTVISQPSFPNPFGSGNTEVRPQTSSSIRTIAGDFVAGYRVQSQVSLEQRLPGQMGFTISYQNNRGLHQQRSRNINAPLPGLGVRPDPTRGNINQYEAVGKSWSNNLHISFRQNYRSERGWSMNLNTNYTLGFSRDDAGTPSNHYNLAADWGRAGNDRRHQFRTGININAPWGISLSPNINASSGSPYNITTGFDDNGDTQTNDRPLGLPRNAGQGPGSYNVDLNFRKQFTLAGGERETAAAASTGSFFPPQRGGGPGGRPGGGVGGGRGNQNSPLRMTFSANIRNVLNHTQVTGISGVMTSPFFGLPTRAANGRSVNLGLQFNF